MRCVSVVAVLILFVFALAPVRAQVIFERGFYEFEDNISVMTYTGTWSTASIYSIVETRTTSAAGASVEFLSGGMHVVIWRLMRQNGVSSRMDVCVNGGSCINVSNESTSTVAFFEPFVIYVPFGGSTITITQTLGQIYLNSFMVLDEPAFGGGMPTAVPTVPTATILPSSTPAYTATPGPTPVDTATAVPTATPYTLPSAIIAINPNASYGDYNGQIVAWEYSFTAGEVVLAALLAGLLGMQVFSWWTGDRGDQQ